MSYILDALNKSEQERREENEVPSLLAVHDSVPHQTSRPAMSVWLPVAVVLLVLVVYLLAALLADGPAATAEAPTAQPEQVSADPATSPPLPTLQPATSLTTAAPAAQPQPTATPGRETVNSTAARIQDLYTGNHSEATSPTQTGPEQAPKLANNAAPGHSTEIRQQAEQEKLQRLLADEEARKLAAQIQADSFQPYVPGIQQLSAALRNQLPALNYSAHIYSADEKSGFVIINSRKRYAGSVIAPELFVESIREDDVVLNFKGYSFALPAMRSWQGR